MPSPLLAQEPAEKPKEEAAPSPARLIRVRIHKEAARWEPVSVRAGGEASAAKTHFTRRVRTIKAKGGAKRLGDSSKAQAVARSYSAGEDTLLVVSVHPAKLKRLGRHLEVRYLVVEGFLEEVKVAAVVLQDPRAWPWPGPPDSFLLRRLGIAFSEEFPAEAEVRVSAINPRIGRSVLNAGSVKGAAFGDRELGLVSLGYATTGVSAGR